MAVGEDEERRAEVPWAKGYYAAAQAWDRDVVRSAIVARNRALVFALVCLLVAFTGVFAVASLAPLKSVETVVLAYDSRTGVLRKVSLTDEAQKITTSEAYLKNQIHAFVVARESWDPLDQAYRAEVVRRLLVPPLRADYDLEYERSRPDAAVNLLGRNTTRSVRVQSITFVGQRTAQVSFSSTDRLAAGGQPRIRDWIATMSFAFEGPPVIEQELFVNPFGFQITGYRRDAVAEQ